jgi:hypothetical protein
VEAGSSCTKSGYRTEILKISRVQNTDLGKYEATASYNDERYSSRAELELSNAGSSVVSSNVSI